ncbi:hypothetical protein IGK47_001881 [Enterococcus sp. AZ007]
MYQSRVKPVGLLFLILFLFFTVLLSLDMSHERNRYLLSTLFLLGISIFLLSKVSIVELFKRKKLVLLNDQGFYYYLSHFDTYPILIPWTKVKKIKEKQIKGQVVVSVYLVDNKFLLAKSFKIQQEVIQMNRAMGLGQINISLQSAKNCTSKELVEKMNEFRVNRHANQRINEKDYENE